MFWKVFGILVAIITVFAVIGLVAMTRAQGKRSSTKKPLDLSAFFNRAVIEVVIGLVVCHGLLLYFWPSLWFTLASQPIFWVDHFVLGGVFALLKNPDKTIAGRKFPGGFRFPAGWIMTILLVGNTVAISAYWKENGSKMFPAKASGDITLTDNTPAKPLPLPRHNAQGETEVRNFWGSKNYTQEEVEEMVEIGRHESQFNQFETDGSPLRGRENPQDVGIYQINEGWWLSTAQALNLDIYTLEGNLEMADYIRRHHGADEWNTSEIARMTARRKAFVIDAPPGGVWSERVPTVGSTSLTPSAPVWITTNRGGDPISLVPGERKNIGDTTWTRFSSQSSEAVKVTVKRE